MTQCPLCWTQDMGRKGRKETDELILCEIVEQNLVLTICAQLMNFTWKVWVSSIAEFPRLRSIGSATQPSFSDPEQGFELFACCCWKAAVVLIVWSKWRRINRSCRWRRSTKSENVLTTSAPAVFRLCSRQPVRNCQVRVELVGALASPLLLSMSTYMCYWLPDEQLLEERMSGPKRVWKAPSSPGCVIFCKRQSSPGIMGHITRGHRAPVFPRWPLYRTCLTMTFPSLF